MEDQNHDQETFLAGKSTPVMFASAVLNFGIHKLLDMLVDLAPAAEARLDKDDEPVTWPTRSPDSSSRSRLEWTPTT
ncbi:hypothetical protein [Brevibacterium sp. UCMA 11754]|uniref:hypothetical protein n=1 Tax=Brevibacterium sp. UCMA 11754 TaxID=2749198 RepID=UPI002E1E4D59